MYMQHLQPQQQTFLAEDSRRIIDKVQTLRSSNQHFKSTSDVKYSNQLDHQSNSQKIKVADNSASTVSRTINSKQSNQLKSGISNPPYQMTGIPSTQRNYLQVGKIDLESAMGQNKKIPATNYIPNLQVNQVPATQRDTSKRQTLPPDRRSFQDQFNTTPVNVSGSNVGQQQQVAAQQQINQANNMRNIQSQNNIHRGQVSTGVGNISINGQPQQPQQQPQINLISLSAVPQNQSQFEDLEKYRKQMQQKGTTAITSLKQPLVSYQNNQNTAASYNRQSHNSEINILYYKGNTSSYDQNQNGQNRIPSDSQLNLPPSPTKFNQKNSQQDSYINQQKPNNQSYSQKLNVPDYVYATNTNKNVNSNAESNNQLGNAPYVSQKPLASASIISNNISNQPSNTNNFLSTKNIAFQYADSNQVQNKTHSHSASIHQNVPQSPQSVGFIGLNKTSLSNLVQSQQVPNITSLNPSLQNSMVNQNHSSQSPKKPSSTLNTNTFNSKNQSIDDILKNLKSKEANKSQQSAPQRIFSSTLSGGQFKNLQGNYLNQAVNNQEVTGQYQLPLYSAGREANVEKKSDLPISNPTQILSLNSYALNEKRNEVKPTVMRQNSDKLQYALTNRNINDYSSSSINLQNNQPNQQSNNNNNNDYSSIQITSRNPNEISTINTSYNHTFENLNHQGFGSSSKQELNNTSNILGTTSQNQLLQSSLPQQRNDFLRANNQALTQTDFSSNNYSIQTQKHMFGSSNLSNRIIPNANFTASHTYDKNINTNQSINTTITSSQNNNILNVIPQQQLANQSYFGNTFTAPISEQNKITNNLNSPILNPNTTRTASNSAINNLQTANDSTIRKQSDSLQSQPFSITNSQNQFSSNISSYYNSPNLQYIASNARQNDLSNNSILSSMNFAGTTASGLTTSRINNNVPTTSVSVASIVKQIPQTISQTEEEKVKQSSNTQNSQLSKRESEINIQKALDEIKPSQQVEKILDEIRRKNSSGMNKDSKQTSNEDSSAQKNNPQIQNAQQQQQQQQQKVPNSNLLQSIQNINMDVKGILQNTISKNITTVSNQYQQLLYRGNPINNNNEYNNNTQSQQSAVDKILQEIKRNDMKKQLQSALTVNSQINSSNSNIQNGNHIYSSPSLTATAAVNQNNIYNSIGLKSNYLSINNQNILDLSNQNIGASPNLTCSVSNPIPSNQQYFLDINKSYSATTNQQFSPAKQNENTSQLQQKTDESNQKQDRKALENELDSHRIKQEQRKQRLSSFSNNKKQHHLDIPNGLDDSINDGQDSIGSHESFIEERESIQKFSTNCSQLTTDPLRQTKILILNSIISKDSFKKDDLSASKQPESSSMSFSQNQAEFPNQVTASSCINETRGTFHSPNLAPVQQNETIFKSTSQPASKEPTLASFNQIHQIDDLRGERQLNKLQTLNQIGENDVTQTDKSTQQEQKPLEQNQKYGEKDFYFVKKLGKGKHSEVFLAQDKRTGFLFAVKQVHKGDIIQMGMEEQFSNEIKIQMCLNHPNIIRMYGFYEDENYFYLLMEYAPGGEIYRYQKTLPEGRFTEAEAAFYLMQLAGALKYLHSNNIIHRDIKPENLLLSNGIVKLADFGYSRICDFKSTRSTFCGTLDYLSPQVVNGQEYNHDVDVWAFGVLCYEFLQGVAPFYEKSKDDTLDKISSGKFQFIKPLSSEAQHFIRILLDTESKNRISINNVCRNIWLMKNVEKYQQEQGPIEQREMMKIFN